MLYKLHVVVNILASNSHTVLQISKSHSSEYFLLHFGPFRSPKVD